MAKSSVVNFAVYGGAKQVHLHCLARGSVQERNAHKPTNRQSQGYSLLCAVCVCCQHNLLSALEKRRLGRMLAAASDPHYGDRAQCRVLTGWLFARAVCSPRSQCLLALCTQRNAARLAAGRQSVRYAVCGLALWLFGKLVSAHRVRCLPGGFRRRSRSDTHRTCERAASHP